MTGNRGRGGSSRRPQAAFGPVPRFDLYRVLGVRPDATHQEIVEAIAALEGRLRTAAARDRGGATARQKRLNVARHWLTDPGRRRHYDLAVARGEVGPGAPATAPLRGARLGAGAATRRPAATGYDSWLGRPLAWVGGIIVLAIAGFLILRPGGLGGGSPTASTNPSTEATGGAPSGSVDAGIPAGCPQSQPSAAPAGGRPGRDDRDAQGIDRDHPGRRPLADRRRQLRRARGLWLLRRRGLPSRRPGLRDPGRRRPVRTDVDLSRPERPARAVPATRSRTSP